MKHGLMSPEKLEIPDAAYAAGERAAVRYVAEADALDVASDVLHAAVPLDRAAALRQASDELEVVALAWRADGRMAGTSGLREAIRHLRVSACCYDGG